MDSLQKVVDMLLEEKQLPPKYFDHALIGKYKGFRECHIEPNWLLIYMIEKQTKTLRLARTGSHSELLNI